MITIRFLATCCLMSALIGCGGGTPDGERHVTGTVTFDGAPVETGRILFRELSEQQRGFSGEIKNGAYELTAAPGKMRVEILASRPVPGKFDTAGGSQEPTPVGEMYIPAKYNEKSELTAEVTAGSSNEIPFDLKSK